MSMLPQFGGVGMQEVEVLSMLWHRKAYGCGRRRDRDWTGRAIILILLRRRVHGRTGGAPGRADTKVDASSAAEGALVLLRADRRRCAGGGNGVCPRLGLGLLGGT